MSTTSSTAPRSREHLLGRWSFWRRLVQILSLALLAVIAARYAFGFTTTSIEAYCPFGAIETLWSTLDEGTYLRHLAASNGVVLIVVAVSGLFVGRAFCGWVCPLGTVQDLFAALAMGWVIWASATAFVPPLAPFCPYRTLFEFNANSLLSIAVIMTFATSSMLVERLWCRYLCPLGGLIGLMNRISPIRPRVNRTRCVSCGRCGGACPAGVDPVADGTDHPECIRCYACVEACPRPGAVQVGLRGGREGPADTPHIRIKRQRSEE